jgi:hypothetical protein
VVLDEADDVFQHDYNNPMGRPFSKADEGKAWTNGILENNANPVIWISSWIEPSS